MDVRFGGISIGILAVCLSVFTASGQSLSGPPSGRGGKAPVSSAASSAGIKDIRLVEAVKRQERQAVQSLLKQHVDVNTSWGDGTTPLSWAAYWDDLETAKSLIGLGAKVNAADDSGGTPLYLACSNGSTAMVEVLLNAGATPNAALWTGESPLMSCARTGSVSAVRLLLAKGADPNAKENRHGRTALMWAVAEKHPEVARLLIEHGADVRVRAKGGPVVLQGCDGENYNCRKMDVRDRKDGFTPLMFASQAGDLDSVRLLLAARANMNDATPEDGGAAMIAAANGHEALAVFLVNKGADPNVADDTGMTALHYAVLHGVASMVGVRKFRHMTAYMFQPNMPELAKALLGHGANPNPRIKKVPRFIYTIGATMDVIGATPLLAATATCDTNLMRILIAGGADPALTTADGTTPLMVAAGLGTQRGDGGVPFHTEPISDEESRALEAIKLLLDLGADINAPSKSGMTALHAAAHDGADAIIELLAAKGAKLDLKDNQQRTALSMASGGAVPHRSTVDLLMKLNAVPGN